MYDEHEDYDGYEDYPPRYHRPRRPRRFSLHWKWPALVLVVVVLASLRFCNGGSQRARTAPPRRQSVKVVNWQDVDIRIRAAVESARDKAVRHAETDVGQWTRELRARTDDYCNWYFSWANQNALALKVVGYHVASSRPVEALLGNRPSAEERLSRLIEEAYSARVLQPQSAQLKIEAVTRESVEIYLLELSSLLSGLQAEFGIPDMVWQRHLINVAGLTLAIEGCRQVPVITKVAIAGSGLAAAKAVRVAVEHVRALVLRTTGRKLLGSGAGAAGRKVIRGGGWWLAVGLVVWDAVDTARVKSRNLPVLRRSLNGYLDELEQHILHDSETGVIQVLDGVQRDMLRQLEAAEK